MNLQTTRDDRSLGRCAALLALALLPTLASGEFHQICYQGADAGGVPRVTVACRSDDPAIQCHFTVPAPWTMLELEVGQGYRTATYEIPRPAGPDTASTTVTFGGTLTRSCSVELYKMGRQVGALFGYTTDASGLLTTGVWASQDCPYGFQATSAGGEGAEFPWGVLVGAAYPMGSGVTKFVDPSGVQSGPTTPYVVGLRVEGVLDQQALFGSGWENAFGTTGEVSTATARLGAGRVLVGGGGQAGSPWAYDHALTGSYPALTFSRPCALGLANAGCLGPYRALGWTAGSKGYQGATGSVRAWLTTLPSAIAIGGVSYRVRTELASSTSGLASHPRVITRGLPPGYALSAVGGLVSWEPYGTEGNYLWRLLPLPAGRAAAVASKDHVYSNPATLVGYAIGVRLELPP